MSKVLVMINSLGGLYNFRKEVIQSLLQQGYEVFISAPMHERSSFFIDMGCEFIPTPISRRGTSIIDDCILFLTYLKIIIKHQPDIVLTYTIKPNIYGGLASRVLRKRAIHTVTGLGSLYIRKMWQSKFVKKINRLAFKSAAVVFFLNKHNREFYLHEKIVSYNQPTVLVPGSGVNINEIKYRKPKTNGKVVFTFIGRVFKDKGIDEYLEAAKKIKIMEEDVVFQVVGSIEEGEYSTILNDYESKGYISYLGQRNDVFNIMETSDCIVLPSYGEGRGTVLQEGAAVGRALITTRIYGCEDNVDDNVNGYLCEVKDAISLEEKMLQFLRLTQEERKIMGQKSREKAEREFDREIVIKAYVQEINKLVKMGEIYESV